MNRHPTLLSLLGGLGLALLFVGACPQFGDDYPCDDDSECLNGMVCGSGGLCVDAASDAGGDDGGGFDGSVPDGGTADGGDDGGTADGGDDGGTADGGDDGGTADGGSDGGTTSFWPMPDSFTATCSDGTAVENCNAALAGPYPRQDGHVTGPMATYTIDGEFVIDELTGLQWERNSQLTPRTLEEADTYCTGTSFQDRDNTRLTGWRLPTYAELMSLADWGRTGAVQRLPVEFGWGPDDRYWSSETDPLNAQQYTVGFEIPTQDEQPPGDLVSVRCVRGELRWQGPLESSGLSKLDPTTGLVWAGNVQQNNATLEEAFTRCATHNEGGLDWRLPNLKEWASVLDVSKGGLLPRVRDGHPATEDNEYWSSTPGVHNFASGFYVMHLGVNNKVFIRPASGSRPVMCVADAP